MVTVRSLNMPVGRAYGLFVIVLLGLLWCWLYDVIGFNDCDLF